MNKQRDDIMQALGDSFSQFKRAMQLYSFQNYGDQNVSPAQLGVLHIIHDLQPISHKALAQALHMTPGAVSQLIDGLQEMHCIIRTPNEADRRISYLSISRHGKQLMDTATKLRNKLLASAFVDVPADDLQTFIRVQQNVTNWLSNQTTNQK